MRQVKVGIYKFNELDTEAKQKAREWWLLCGDIRYDSAEEDIFRIIKPEDLIRENLSVMKVDVRFSSICDICGRDIIFDENLAGLTIRGEFFSCEKCCRDASKETLDSWVEYKMGKPKDIIPIVLWLMEEKKRTELFK